MRNGNILGGTDGYRGVYTEELGPGQVNAETFAGLTHALLSQPETAGPGPVVVARDTRPSSLELADAVIVGALYQPNTKVFNLGIAPTPMAQKVSERLGAIATVVVTASHNHHSENGWKGMVGNSKPSSDLVKRISASYWQSPDVPKTSRYSYHVSPEQIDWYIGEVVRDIEQHFGAGVLDGKVFIYDGAYGAAQHVTPRVLRDLGAIVHETNNQKHGLINDGCGAADLSGLDNFMRSHEDIVKLPAFVGAIANDGDGDRMMAMGARVDNEIRQPVMLNGNHTMWTLARDQQGIVGTHYTNSGLTRALQEAHIGFEYCENGDRYVTEKLHELQAAGKQWTRGGEFTGHTIDLSWLPSGDGIRSAAWLAAYAAKTGQTFADLHEDLPLWPERIDKARVSPDISSKVLEDDGVVQALDAARDALGDDGRLLVRASGTEPLIRVWVEDKLGNKLSLVDKLVAHIGAVAAKLS